MKKVYYVLISLLLTIAGCTKNDFDPELNANFIGEYVMKSEVYGKIGDSIFPLEIAKNNTWTQASIYEKDRALYVQTCNFGNPKIDTPAIPIAGYIDNPISTKKKPSAIEPVTQDTIPRVIMMNGYLFTICQGMYRQSLPIRVYPRSATRLTCAKCETFQITFTTAPDPVNPMIKDLQYQYGDIIKNDSTLTWAIKLPMNLDFEGYGSYQYEIGDTLIYKNELYNAADYNIVGEVVYK